MLVLAMGACDRDTPPGPDQQLPDLGGDMTRTKDGPPADQGKDAPPADLGKDAVVKADGPRGVSLSNVWGLGPNGVWIVGQKGTLLHHDGAKLSSVTSGTTADLSDVWGSSASDMWVVGDGVILRSTGSGWSKVFTPKDHSAKAAPMYAIHGSSASNIWAGGGSGAIYHYDGTKWAYRPPFESLGLWLADVAVTPTKTWAVLSMGGVHTHDKSKGWVKVFTSPGGGSDMRAMWFNSPKDIWIVGDLGMVYRYDGSKWTKQLNVGGKAYLTDVWASSATDVWVLGGSSTFLRYDGKKWSTVPGVAGQPFTAIWGTSPSDVWAVGAGCLIMRYDGAKWSKLNKPAACL